MTEASPSATYSVPSSKVRCVGRALAGIASGEPGSVCSTRASAVVFGQVGTLGGTDTGSFTKLDGTRHKCAWVDVEQRLRIDEQCRLRRGG